MSHHFIAQLKKYNHSCHKPRYLMGLMTTVLSLLALSLSSHANTIAYQSIGEFGEISYSQFPPSHTRPTQAITLRGSNTRAHSTTSAPTNQSNNTTLTGNTSKDSTVASSSATNAPPKNSLQTAEQRQHEQQCAVLRQRLADLNALPTALNIEQTRQRENILKVLSQYCA